MGLLPQRPHSAFFTTSTILLLQNRSLHIGHSLQGTNLELHANEEIGRSFGTKRLRFIALPERTHAKDPN